MAARGKIVAVLFCFMAIQIQVQVAKKNAKRDLIDKVADVKEFKKLIRTRNNVLAIFSKTGNVVSSDMDMYAEVADEMRGLGTLVLVDCSEAKKLCKKMKVSPANVELKHYKDGEFNKDYDRKKTVKSMVNFMRDPTGDIPWEEDATGQDVLHIENKAALTKILKSEKKPMLIMFYAPWCGFCKKLKPDYAAAATELKPNYVMAGMDVDKPENMAIRTEYNITGFPTIYLFEKGKYKYKYGGENNKEGLISWMKNPQPPKEPEKELEWSESDNQVEHLTDSTFDDFLQSHNSVLVMFYAPWCGHCKKMKPEYDSAALTLKEEGIEGVVAAVDATKEKSVGDRFKIKGYPTVKYFKDGEEAFDFNERTAEKIVEFLKNPQEPPPPPPPEPAWSEVKSEIIHLTDENMKSTLKKKKHSLVMFYAPWCGHCKAAKPEYTAAAEKFKDDNKVAFAALDCTHSSEYTALCTAHEVTGYPTFKYFNYGKNAQKYTGGREEADFVNFMNDPLNPMASAPPPPPPPETHWKDAEGHENVVHLTDATFDETLQQHSSALVMFYAPWCGHCKAMKPAYAEAASLLKQQNIEGVLAAVDATAERTLQSRFEIKGYPTIKYFVNGQEKFEYNRGRTTNDFVSFIKNPESQPPTPAPPTEPKWSDEESSVHHLQDFMFDEWLSGKNHALVMFYAPWCGHCKKAKPEFTAAANEININNSLGIYFGAVDCTVEEKICTGQKVSGYPTFKYYKNGKFIDNYTGGRTKVDFIKYVVKPPSAKEEL